MKSAVKLQRSFEKFKELKRGKTGELLIGEKLGHWVKWTVPNENFFVYSEKRLLLDSFPQFSHLISYLRSMEDIWVLVVL